MYNFFRFLIITLITILLSLYAHAQNGITLSLNLKINIGLYLELLIFIFITIFIVTLTNKKLKTYLLFILSSIYFFIVTLQILSVESTGYVLNLVSLNNTGQMTILLNEILALKLIIALIFFSIILYQTIKIKKTSINILFIYIIIILFSYYTLLQYKHTKYFHRTISQQHIFSPAANLYALMRLNNEVRNREYTSSLSAKEINIAKHFNIDINTSALYPFKKPYLFKEDLPFKNIQPNIQPNIIVFFIESLSARLLGAYNPYMKNVTPNINAFSKKSMLVTGYYNHATPTTPGLYGQHCSLYPLLTFYDMENTEKNPLKDLRLKCMPHYFSEHGYETTYLSHAREYHGNMEKNLALWGYKKTYMWQNLLNHYLPNQNLYLDETGLSDHQMMMATVNFLKQTQDKPFFLALSTIESHIGFTPNNIDGKHYKKSESNTLNMIHNTDDAFKIFWNYFKTSKYYHNTIVILTGDHALYPNNDYRKVVSKEWIPSVYDALSLIIYDPIHKLPSTFETIGTSVDLAPTLLQLANIEKISENSFLGTSLFDKRTYPNSFGISAYPDFSHYINKNGTIENTKYNNDESTFKALKNVLEYTKYLQEMQRF